MSKDDARVAKAANPKCKEKRKPGDGHRGLSRLYLKPENILLDEEHGFHVSNVLDHASPCICHLTNLGLSKLVWRGAKSGK
jgi:hypothetical protein